MRLILVRHGDAFAGFDGVVSGPIGCEGLTALGRRQAEALRDYLTEARRITADFLLASVLPRAIETAEIIAPGLDLQVGRHDCDLCEIHTGVADGLLWAEYAERYGQFDMEADPERVFAPGGESWSSFHERVGRMLDKIAREFADQTVVAVCHAGVIMASLRILFDIPHTGVGARIRPTNTGLTEWEYEPNFDRWTLHSFNEHTHLLGLTDDEADRASEYDGKRGGEACGRSLLS
jgi:broad specificity phosphatase PhoE